MAAGMSLTLAACSLVEGEEGVLTADLYEGVYSQGIEDSTFEPCGRDEVWQIEFDDEAVTRVFIDQVSEVIRQGENPMYARLRGTLSPRGQYPGIFIVYDRELTIIDTEEVRPLQDSDCQP